MVIVVFIDNFQYCQI